MQNLRVHFTERISPSKLPEQHAAPVHLALVQQISTLSGVHPPALQELRVDLDRHLGLSVKGLPRCPGPLNESGPRTGKPAVCEGTQVGSGQLEVEIAFPEQQPVRISGRVIVYNGGVRNGRTKFWLYAYLPAPVTGAVLMPLEIRRGGYGRFGWIGELEFPKIANGAASVTSLAFGFRKGIFSASCAGGQFWTRYGDRFADGSELGAAGLTPCTARG